MKPQKKKSTNLSSNFVVVQVNERLEFLLPIELQGLIAAALPRHLRNVRELFGVPQSKLDVIAATAPLPAVIFRPGTDLAVPRLPGVVRGSRESTGASQTGAVGEVTSAAGFSDGVGDSCTCYGMDEGCLLGG